LKLLEISGLHRSFGSLKAVDGIDLALAEGVALGVVGPNGAGKTTLFNLIAGDLAPEAGAIRFAGVDITGMPPHRRCVAGIARTYQIPRPFENLTVFENLLVGAVYGSGKSERAAAAFCADVLAETGLYDRANRRAGALTLLERKRLELARALATGPRLLLLDEIAGGLTEGECGALVETIRAIRAHGITIVWIEHIVHALLAVVDQLIALDFGRKISEGEPHAVMGSSEVRQIYMGIEG